jgi:hypothetical protein
MLLRMRSWKKLDLVLLRAATHGGGWGRVGRGPKKGGFFLLSPIFHLCACADAEAEHVGRGQPPRNPRAEKGGP